MYGPKYGLVIAVFCEAVVISWIYGLNRFKADIKEMIGFEPGPYWCLCWAAIAPVYLVVRQARTVYGNVKQHSSTYTWASPRRTRQVATLRSAHTQCHTRWPYSDACLLSLPLSPYRLWPPGSCTMRLVMTSSRLGTCELLMLSGRKPLESTHFDNAVEGHDRFGDSARHQTADARQRRQSLTGALVISTRT